MQDSILLARVFQGLIDIVVFEDFIKQLLYYCSKQLKPKSILIIDNALFYYLTKIEELYKEAKVKLLYLPLYSPDLNLIKEFFVKLKIFIKRNQQLYINTLRQDFKIFLKQCINIIRVRKLSAEGHFRHFKLFIKEL